jgi:hypothetical protein
MRMCRDFSASIVTTVRFGKPRSCMNAATKLPSKCFDTWLSVDRCTAQQQNPSQSFGTGAGRMSKLALPRAAQAAGAGRVPARSAAATNNAPFCPLTSKRISPTITSPVWEAGPVANATRGTRAPRRESVSARRGAAVTAGQTAGSTAGMPSTSWDERRHEQGTGLVGAEVDPHAVHIRGCTHARLASSGSLTPPLGAAPARARAGCTGREVRRLTLLVTRLKVPAVAAGQKAGT